MSAAGVIRASDRVSSVLKRDEGLLEVFVSASPHFAMLRNKAARRTMARLVTIEQAARIAGIETAMLLDKLNAACGEAGEVADDDEATGEPATEATGEATNEAPAWLLALPPERLVDLDVRDDLRRGQEPFQKIIQTVHALQPGQVLRLRATFEPAPLYAVLGKQGLAHWTERFAADDWRVWFHRDEAGAAASVTTGTAAAPAMPADGDVEILDVRGLEPPEPMVRTLEALEHLAPGKTLVQLNVRVPQFLLPQLDERGFTYEVREQSPELVRLFIRHKQA